MAAGTGLTYRFFPLTENEGKDGKCCTINYAIEHRDRWIDIDRFEDQLQTYDRCETFLLVNDNIYQVVQDCLMYDDKIRVYIGRIKSKLT